MNPLKRVKSPIVELHILYVGINEDVSGTHLNLKWR